MVIAVRPMPARICRARVRIAADPPTTRTELPHVATGSGTRSAGPAHAVRVPLAADPHPLTARASATAETSIGAKRRAGSIPTTTETSRPTGSSALSAAANGAG
jgi:hypothetical protein